MRIVLLVSCVVLTVLNGYQAVTGNRVSKRPSRRSDEVLRRQSALAFAFGTVLTLLVLLGG